MLFRDPSVLMIFGVLAVAFVGINLLSRFFQMRDQKAADAAREEKRRLEQSERDAKRAVRTSTPDGARPARRQASPAPAPSSLRSALINQGIIRPATSDDDLDAGQHSNNHHQPAQVPQIGDFSV